MYKYYACTHYFSRTLTYIRSYTGYTTGPQSLCDAQNWKMFMFSLEGALGIFFQVQGTLRGSCLE